MHPLSLKPKAPQSDCNWAVWRRPEAAVDRALQDETLAWLVSLPETARPYSLAQAFPRIANRLAQLVPEPHELERYMDSLLVDHRGNRQGFPMAVLRDLINLHQHFQATHGYHAQRRRVDIKAKPRRSSRHADLELVHQLEAPQWQRSRSRAAAAAAVAPRPAGFWSRLAQSLRPSFL